MKRRIIPILLAVLVAAGSLTFGGVAEAGRRSRSRSQERNWRIGTYIGSAATIAALAKGEGVWALVGGGATLLSYSQWRKEMRRRHRRESRAGYHNYRSRWFRRHRGHRVYRR